MNRQRLLSDAEEYRVLARCEIHPDGWPVDRKRCEHLASICEWVAAMLDDSEEAGDSPTCWEALKPRTKRGRNDDAVL